MGLEVGVVWNGFIWLITATGSRMLQTLKRNSGLHTMRGIYGLDEQLLASQEILRSLKLACRPLIGTMFSHNAQLVSELNIDGNRVGMLTLLAFLTSVQRVQTALSQFVTAFCLVFVRVRQTDQQRPG